ncbi:hypothetical protein MRX96_014425 [Rhipicephalus microplus]
MDDDILGAGSRLLAASANTIVDGLKKYLRPVSPDSLPLPKDTKSLFDFDKDDSFSPVPQSVEPSIVIFRGATGLVTDITDFGGTIEVQDQACSVGSLKVNFLSGVFYSNGVGCTKRLCEVLGCGDVVSLDFMVGSNGGHEEVWCDLVWQGARPQGVIQMSPEDFCRQLQIKVPARHGGTLVRRLPAGIGGGGPLHVRAHKYIEQHQPTQEKEPPQSAILPANVQRSFAVFAIKEHSLGSCHSTWHLRELCFVVLPG